MLSQCPKCGTPRAGGESACRNCGSELTPLEATIAPAAPAAELPAAPAAVPQWSAGGPTAAPQGAPQWGMPAAPMAPVPGAMPTNCWRCGAPLYPGYRICANCGLDLSPAWAQGPKRRSKLPILVGLAVVAVVAVVGGYLLLNRADNWQPEAEASPPSAWN